MQLSFDIPFNRENWHAHYCGEISQANSVGIMGRSGSGKSTLLRIISGLEKTKHGTLTFQGNTWLGCNAFVKPQQRNIAYVTQDSLLFPHLTIGNNLRLVQKNSRLTLDEQQALLEKTDIITWLEKKPSELSGGQRQRVSLVQALMQTPKLLLCDEPLSALDAQSRKELIAIIGDFITRYDIPMIYISHHAEEVIALTDHCLIIDNGEIVNSGKTNTILSTTLPKVNAVNSVPSVTLPFQVVKWHTNENTYEIKLINTNGGITEQTIYFSSNERINDKIIHLDISANNVVLSPDKINQTSLDNYLKGELKTIVENDSEYTLGVNVAGYLLYSVISKRAYKKTSLNKGDIVYVYLSNGFGLGFGLGFSFDEEHN